MYHGVLNTIDDAGAAKGTVEVAVKIFKTTMRYFLFE